MSFIAAAVVVGAGASAYGAVSAADAQKDAANTAAGAQTYAADQSLAAQREGQTRSEYMTDWMRQLGLNAAPQLQSAVLGGPVSYRDPNYTLATSDQIAKANRDKFGSYWWMNGADKQDGYIKEGAYVDKNGNFVDPSAVPTKTANYQMQESPAAKWQLQEGTKYLNRQQAARGLSGSGNAVNRLSELSQSIKAKDWNDQYSRLLDLTKIGSGASSSAGASSVTTGQGVANTYQNQGNALANSAMASGQAQAGLYSGLGSAVSSTTGNALKAYDLYNGFQGGGSNTDPYGALNNGLAASDGAGLFG